MPLFTLGHGTANAGRLAELLGRAGVVLVVDVRREPGSRRNPDAARDALARWLPEQGVAYRWDVRLGGRRPDVAGSPDTAPPHRTLAGYAAHMRTPEFAAAVEDLLAGPAPAAVLCSEGDWRRCHRQMIADHVVTATARLREDGRLVYDGGQATLL